MAYPRSFLGLCLASFILVAVPLVAALAYSAWHSERLADRSRSAVFNASQAARASRTLVNRISSLERLATLDAPGFDADLGRVHASFRQVAHELLQLPLEEDQRAGAPDHHGPGAEPLRAAHGAEARRPPPSRRARRRPRRERLRGARHQHPGRRPRGDAAARRRRVGAAPARSCSSSSAPRWRSASRSRSRAISRARSPSSTPRSGSSAARTSSGRSRCAAPRT